MLFSFLRLHFPLSTFSGRLQIGCRGSSSVSIVPALTCDYSSLAFQLTSFYLSDRADYYISSNAFSGVQRSLNGLFSLHNIVLDVDCHGDDFSGDVDFLCDSLLFRLDSFFFDSVVSTPTSIVKTGRGLQFWWSIEGISVKFKSFYDELVDFYISALAQVLVEGLLDDFSMFQVDEVASRNAAGYFRLPGTYNTRVKRLVTFTSSQKQYHLMELFEEMKAKRVEFNWVKLEVFSFEVSGVTEITSREWLDIAEIRVQGFQVLRQLRNECIGSEERNNFCFVFYNALLPGCGHEIAYQRLKGFNEGFKVALTERELGTVISSARKKGGYQYTNDKIVEFLHISSEEAPYLEFLRKRDTYLTKKKQKQVQVLTKKQKRDAEVLALYDGGMTAEKVALKVGLSAPTVAKILKENKKNHQEERRGKVKELRTQGKTIGEIATICNCSTRTVKRLLSAPEG